MLAVLTKTPEMCSAAGVCTELTCLVAHGCDQRNLGAQRLPPSLLSPWSLWPSLPVPSFPGRVHPPWFLRSEDPHAVLHKALGAIRALGALSGRHVCPAVPRLPQARQLPGGPLHRPPHGHPRSQAHELPCALVSWGQEARALPGPARLGRLL